MSASTSSVHSVDYAFHMPKSKPAPATATADLGRSVADRVFTVLEALADADAPPTLSELADLTDLPMPTIHRLLRFLTSQGYVRQEPSKRYALGLRMIRFGQSASRGLDSWAAPHLAGLVEKFGETTNMAMLEGDSCVYVAQVPSPRAMRMFTEVGHVVMPHCTGVGKAILSMLTDEQVTSLLKRTGMPARTDHTLTSTDAMIATLHQARELGYTLDDGEQEPGVRCVAVPLVGLPFLAAISVAGPSSRMTMEDVPRIAPELQAVAAEIGRRYRSDDFQTMVNPSGLNDAS
jgi:IclR family transcriptional regulator, acetate operon repressor